jgi:hypothetical protein
VKAEALTSATAPPEVTPPQSADEEPPAWFVNTVKAISFILGAATFVVANFFLFLMAFPTMPNPGPQADIRLPLYGLVLVVILITFLLGRPGAMFGAGFASGFMVELLFMSACVSQWAEPGGTALKDARMARRAEVYAVEAEAQAKRRWIIEMREHGLDIAVGVRRLRLAAGCVLDYRKKQGKYPAVKPDSLPDFEEGYCSELPLRKADESGWRVLYSPFPDGFRVKLGPDAALRMKGPVLEVDSRQGILLRRDSANGPAFAVASPPKLIRDVTMDCIRRTSELPEVKAEAGKRALTLRDLLFLHHPQGCGWLDMEQLKTESGYILDQPNEALLFLSSTDKFVGLEVDEIATSWHLTYLPHGKTPADGYDLQVRPMNYGFTGIRSYLMTAEGVHVTWEDRGATPSDPLAEPCELDPRTAC